MTSTVLTAPQSATPSPNIPKLRNNVLMQGNVLAGFNKDHSDFLFLQFPLNGGVATQPVRAWLRALLPQLATNADVTSFNERFSAARNQNGGDDPDNLVAVWTGIALTAAGISALKPSLSGDLASFPEFQAGAASRAAILADSDPATWIVGRPDQTIHALVTVAADLREDLEARVQRLRNEAAAAGITIVFEHRGATLTGKRAGHEQFGFKDGISQPGVVDYDFPSADDPEQVAGKPGTDLIQPGEFVLGYTPQNGSAPNTPDWMTNGSFLVFRRLAQDVPGFWAAVEAEVAKHPELNLNSDRLAAKLVGRWRSGTPIDRAPIFDNRSAQDPVHDNDFDFSDDPEGLKCPFAGHIRKVYPRAGGAPFPPEEFNNTKRILRRGIPYGEHFDPAAGRGHGTDDERGLTFVCHTANIADHFEFLQQTWANNASFPDGTTGPDTVIGATPDGSAAVAIPGKDTDGSTIRRSISITRWVTTTGSVYAFTPSIPTIGLLADG